MFEEYKLLPDYTPADDLREYFSRLLYLLENSEKMNLDEASGALRELADRQWHTYEVCDPEIKRRIESWISRIWNVESRRFVINLLFIVGSLGLSDSYNLIKSSLSQKMDVEVRREIESFIQEVEGHIEDPYYGMNRSNGFR